MITVPPAPADDGERADERRVASEAREDVSQQRREEEAATWAGAARVHLDEISQGIARVTDVISTYDGAAGTLAAEVRSAHLATQRLSATLVSIAMTIGKITELRKQREREAAKRQERGRHTSTGEAGELGEAGEVGDDDCITISADLSGPGEERESVTGTREDGT